MSDYGDELDQIQRRADAATEGPWELEPYAGVMCLAVAPNGNLVVDFSTWTDGNYSEMADVEALASFIAHARADVPYLLALVREQAAKLDAVEKLLDEKYKPWAAICGNTCSKDIAGVDHDAIADEVASAIRTAMEATK